MMPATSITTTPSPHILPAPWPNQIASIFGSEKLLPAALSFVDIAGIVKGASTGEGLGNKFLSHIREVDAVLHVVRCFKKGDIIHVSGSVDPKRDIEIIELELQLADLETVSKAVERVAKKAKAKAGRIDKRGM